MVFSTIEVEIADHIAMVTINRAAAMNSPGPCWTNSTISGGAAYRGPLGDVLRMALPGNDERISAGAALRGGW